MFLQRRHQFLTVLLHSLLAEINRGGNVYGTPERSVWLGQFA